MKISTFNSIASITLFCSILMSSCGTSESVVSNGFLQKRKYNKGFHKSKKTSVKQNKKESLELFAANTDKVNKQGATSSSVEPTNSTVLKSEAKKTTGIHNQYNREVAQKNEVKTTKKSNGLVANDIELNNKENKAERIKSKKPITIFNHHSNTSSNMADDMTILLIILAFFIPFLAVGIYTNWDLKKTLISVLLMLLFWIPGVIYAILVILDKA